MLFKLRLKKSGPVEECVIEAMDSMQAPAIAHAYCESIGAKVISVSPLVVAGPSILGPLHVSAKAFAEDMPPMPPASTSITPATQQGQGSNKNKDKDK